MEHTLGVPAALVLFEDGLGFEAVVSGLMDELGFTAGQATSAAAAALAELLGRKASLPT